jgi:hypothetical protein
MQTSIIIIIIIIIITKKIWKYNGNFEKLSTVRYS